MKYERYDFDTIASTNTYAKEFARKRDTGCHLPAVFVAREQTGGRGRLGRSFHSARDAGIYLSFLVYPTAKASDATAITAYAAVKLCRAIAAFTDKEIGIKWVNDLVADRKKLAGILTEGEIRADGSLAFAVVGIGLNLYKTELPRELSDIVISLEEATGVRVDREAMAERIIEEFLEGGDYLTDAVFEEYKKRSIVLGRRVTVHTPTGVYEATARELLRDYSLLVEADGEARRIYTGEISVRL